MTTKINVVDSMMGSGKTSHIIQLMKTTPGPWLYVTPLRSEIQRVLHACKEPSFSEPEITPEFDLSKQKTTYRKSNGLNDLLERGENIATTHALFRILDKEAIELIRQHDYKLVLDEVMDVLETVGEKGDSPAKLIEHGILAPEPSPKHEQCTRLLPGPEDGLVKYRHIRKYAEQGRLVGVFNTMLLWLFPADAFEAFSQVWNLTYLFEGSFQKAFFDLYDLGYTKHSVTKDETGYRLVPYNPDLDREAIEKVKTLINLYQGGRNSVGNADSALSSNWWSKSCNSREHTAVMMSAYSWLKQHCRATKETSIWTVFEKIYRGGRGLYPTGHQPSFVPLNTRATNEYRNRDSVAYLVNRYPDPNITTFFEAIGLKLDVALFALSEMIQFIWRSAIRDGKPINLFIPSRRMRRLLMDWLNFNLGNSAEPVKTALLEAEAA